MEARSGDLGSGAAYHYREKILVAKTQLEVKLGRTVGDNKKSF